MKEHVIQNIEKLLSTTDAIERKALRIDTYHKIATLSRVTGDIHREHVLKAEIVKRVKEYDNDPNDGNKQQLEGAVQILQENFK